LDNNSSTPILASLYHNGFKNARGKCALLKVFLSCFLGSNSLKKTDLSLADNAPILIVNYTTKGGEMQEHAVVSRGLFAENTDGNTQ
jgi:hypothetical protein